MPHRLDRTKVRSLLSDCDLRALFIEELGWDHGGENTEIRVADNVYALEAIAQKRGMVAYQYIADSDNPFPDHSTRQKIERAIAKTVREHLIVYVSRSDNALYWQWVKREPGQSDRTRQDIFRRDRSGEALIQKLEQLVFTLDEEDDLTIVDVSGRVRAAFDVEKVTRKFYDRFKKEHDIFLRFIEGIENVADCEWYASLMLNRMMFIYFIQKQGFLNKGDRNYLRKRLQRMQKDYGKDRFQTFYRLFLLRLFHEGLGQPEADRAPDLEALLGQIPYLNGGLFDVHDLERDNTEIHIPDEAFEKIFDFFDAYQWHLDDRPLRKDNEINPDVLGYIFEKYVNQKQMGAYYTKEDITGYISRNTVLPFLFDRAKKECAIAFKPNGGVWRLLSDDPDRYFYEAVRHGITYDIHKREDLKEQRRELPDEIAAGLNDVSKRSDWNKPAPENYALPTETWREHVARRKHYEEVRNRLVNGEVTSINDLITYNLDIEKFALDVIASSEGPELIRAFWKAATKVSVLDPTCGSGAFLFATLNILEPVYTACLEAMWGFLDDLDRSKRKHRPEKMNDFRKVLNNVANHASEDYFILKSIIVDNLYGVDIMEEAVEICKLRLFLKLVAQLDSYDQIEPLPDIDFNVRAGNTLVGFTSMDEIQKAFSITTNGQHRVLYPEDKAKLERIEEDAEIADRAFRQFHRMQVDPDMDANAFTKAKLGLRNRLNDLREELDGYLASEYGKKTDDTEAYGEWRNSHQPFHWFVEFYGIMNSGGFDVIIGNPPYVEYRKVKKRYKVSGFVTLDCGDLYAYVLERSCELSSRGRLGMILPISIMSTDGFHNLRRLLNESSRVQFFQAFAERPSKLFTGVEKRLCVYLLGNQAKKPKLHLSNYRRWFAEERITLFNTTQFVDFTGADPVVNSSVPKIQNEIECRILAKLSKQNSLNKYYEHKSKFPIYYTRKARYFVQFFDFIPDIFDGADNRLEPTELKVLYFNPEFRRDALLALLNSSLFFWFFSVNSDVRNLNRREIDLFPCSLKNMYQHDMSTLESLGRALTRDYIIHSKLQINNYKKYGTRVVQTFQPRESKPIIDKIDRALAAHYGFSDEETDFIINYDIKYRMGRDNLNGKQG